MLSLFVVTHAFDETQSIPSTTVRFTLSAALINQYLHTMGLITNAALLASGLVATVQAGSVRAAHANLHKRHADYHSKSAEALNTTVSACVAYSTYTTTWYGEPTIVWPEVPSSTSESSTSTSSWTTSTSTSHAKPTATSSSVAPPVYTTSASSKTKEVKPSTYVAPSSSSSASAPAYSAKAKSLLDSVSDTVEDAVADVSAAFAKIATNGNQWAMTYTPYAQDGSCKTADAVKTDIRAIKSKGFTTVRIYATDCSGPQNVGAACEAEGLKMILGVYIDSAGIGSGTQDQISTLTSWGKDKWSMVEMVVAGNEAVFNGFTTASALADLITEMRSSFKAVGYTGPITTTDTVATILEYADTFCPVIDVVAANIHPFFNGGFAASGSGDFVATELESLANACNGKEAYNLETGWPSAGNANGEAVPGVAEQKAAIDSIVAKVGSKSAIFSYEDDSWKAPGDLDVEQYWGCASLFADKD